MLLEKAISCSTLPAQPQHACCCGLPAHAACMLHSRWQGGPTVDDHVVVSKGVVPGQASDVGRPLGLRHNSLLLQIQPA
jgi:hypothetical protein